MAQKLQAAAMASVVFSASSSIWAYLEQPYRIATGERIALLNGGVDLGIPTERKPFQ